MLKVVCRVQCVAFRVQAFVRKWMVMGWEGTRLSWGLSYGSSPYCPIQHQVAMGSQVLSPVDPSHP